MIDSQLGDELPDWQIYTPVLRAKASEWKALDSLTDGVRRRIAPILEFVPEWRGPTPRTPEGKKRKTRSPQTADAYVSQMLQRAVMATPNDTRSYAYFGHAGQEQSFQGVDLWAAFEANVPPSSGIIPLVDLSATQTVMSKAARAAQHTGGAVAIRVAPVPQLSDLARSVEGAMNTLRATPPVTHLIIDLKDAPHLVTHVEVRNAFADINSFAYVAMLAGVFPHDLSSYKPGIDIEQRQEWLTWRREHDATPDHARFFAYGDYTTQCAHYQPSPAVPGSVSIRYTTDDAILVFRGRQSNSGAGLGYEQIHGHCRLLVRRPDYDGAAFSDGDGKFFCWTDPTNGTGNPEQWRVASITHHLTHVIVQLQDPTGSSDAIRRWAREQGPANCA